VPVVAEAQEAFAPDEMDEKALAKLEKEMKAAATKLDFERAAEIRDKIKAIKQKMLEVGVE
jgi:excinuclease ABC subunit B